MVQNFENFMNEGATSNTNIQWFDYSEENLTTAYIDYVTRIEADHSLNIVTNVLCVTPWSKPKINNGINRNSKVDYIKTGNKIMTSTLLIRYDEYRNKVIFVFGNVGTLFKFARMEDLNI
jgi:hypothetical protein